MTASYFGLALRWQLLILNWWRHQVKLAGAYYSCVVKWKIARQNHVSLLPLFQDESTCTIQMIIRFTRSHAHFHVNQTHFHLNGLYLDSFLNGGKRQLGNSLLRMASFVNVYDQGWCDREWKVFLWKDSSYFVNF